MPTSKLLKPFSSSHNGSHIDLKPQSMLVAEKKIVLLGCTSAPHYDLGISLVSTEHHSRVIPMKIRQNSIANDSSGLHAIFAIAKFLSELAKDSGLADLDRFLV